jgi:two-component system nitrate/nitrite sensor histidine kinase NarX
MADVGSSHFVVPTGVGSDLLESSMAQRPHELMALFDSSQEIVAQLDLDTLLGTISDQARALMQAEAAFLCLLTPAGDALQLAFSSGWDEAQVGVSQLSTRGLAAQVVGDGSTVVAATQCTNCVILNKFGPGGCVAVPLRAGKSTLGALCVVRAREQSFDADQAKSLRMLANAAAIAIANARLADAARQEAARAAACAEREHLSTELHDNLAQTLASLKLKVGVLEMRLQETVGIKEAIGEELAAMAAAIATAYTQARSALTGLQQPHTPSNNLACALEQSVAEFNAATGIAATLVIADEAALAISAVAQIQVEYIVHEALTNIRRHAQASHVQARVEQRDGLASFVIADDGCGFEPQTVDVEHHLGLAIMHRRALHGGGHLSVHSSPGTGTQVVASFPMTQTAGQERDDG